MLHLEAGLYVSGDRGDVSYSSKLISSCSCVSEALKIGFKS